MSRVIDHINEVQLLSYPIDGLIVEWTGELDGNILVDTYGSCSAPATGTPLNSTGKVGDAVSLDGATRYYLGANRSQLELYQVACSVWVKGSNWTDSNGIFSCFNATNSDYGYYFRIFPSGYPVITSYNNAYSELASTTALNTGEWYHLVFNIKNSSEADIYINGSLDCSGAILSPSYPSTLPFYVTLGGIYITAFSHMFNGDINMCRIYNRALTQAEVTQLYNSGQGI